ncbi:MAG: hypothetical protein ACFFBP_06385 [Promethearchaeota archaeon]
MLIIDNLKLLFKKENRLYLIIVIWLLVGIIIIDFFPIIGIFIFIPYLAFLMFLYLLSLVSKKDIRKFSPLTLIGLLLISIPLMIIIIIVLFVLFAISLISYVLMTSWFILYGLILTSKRVDKTLYRNKLKPLTRNIEFFGGVILSIALLFLFFIAPSLDTSNLIFESGTSQNLILYLNYAYIIVGISIFILFFICFIYIFKKSFNAWYGIFSILIAGYTFFLVLKIFLGITGLGSDSNISTSNTDILTEIGLLITDVLIIVYAISTLLGTKAELLAKQLKYFGIDTIFIWLLFSKASYEFIKNFPYTQLLKLSINVSGTTYSIIPFYDLINVLNSEIINIVKNVAVLVFFIILIVIIGLWEIRKYNRTIFKQRKGEEIELPDLISPKQDILEEKVEKIDEPTDDNTEMDENNQNLI